MSNISFVNPWLLFLILPLAAALCIPFALAVRSDNKSGQNVASLVLHILMAVIIAFAAAGTSIVTVITETNVYVVADVSYSAKKNLDTIDGYIENLQFNLPKNSKMGIVCFGKDYSVLTEMGGEIKSVKQAEIDETETNISEALEFTGGLFSDNVIKRIVLITDGRQSDLRSSNSLKRVADSLALQGVKIDAIYLDDNLSADAKEIQVTSAEYTKTSFLNAADNKVTAFIQSSYNAPNMTVTLSSGGALLESKIVNLSLGTTSVGFNLPCGVKGSFDYEIKVEGLTEEEDVCSYNNKITFTQQVSDAVSVLLVTEKQANVQYINNMYGANCTLTSYVIDDVNNLIPVTVEELCVYDEIVLADVDLKKVESYRIFVDSLDKLVSVFGKNLVTFGDLQIQNTQDEALLQLDSLLPVRYGHSNDDPKLYVVVVDTSRSMETNSRLIMAKEAARRLLGLLDANDYISIVEFNGDVYTALGPTPASKQVTVNNAIDSLGVLQGTILRLGLEKAAEILKDQTAFGEKQVMLITDGLDHVTGDSSSDGSDPVSIADGLRAENIKVSVIDVGRGGNDSPSADPSDYAASQAAIKLLKDIAGEDAAHCAGNYFYSLQPEDLNKLFLEQIPEDMSPSTVEQTVTVIKNRRTDDVLNGFSDDAGTVNGLIVSSAKASATTVLKGEYIKQTTQATTESPLYAYWNYGNGKVSSFTSSLAVAGGWTQNWINADAFFENVLSTNVPAAKADYPYLLSVSSSGNYGTVGITPVNLYASVEAHIEVTAPDGTVTTYDFAPDGSGFTADFLAADVGRYDINIKYLSDGSSYDCSAVMNVSYKSEYDMFAAFDASELYKMVGGNGTVSEDGNLRIENDINEVGTYVYSLVVPLLAVCAVLFIADIIVRKVKWSDVRNLFIRISKK